MLLAYAGFLRSQELVAIKRCGICFENNYMCITIEKSNTDIYREGAWVIMAKTDSPLCPVENLMEYIELLNLMDELSEQHLFCDLSACRSGFKVRTDKKALSYSTLRNLFRLALRSHVQDISKYGLHSLRSGGATKAANMGIPDRLFKLMDAGEVKMPKMIM